MRAVTTATAAVVLGLERKSLDNLLLQLGELALPAGRQGVERRIPIAMLETLALTSALVEGMGMKIRHAFALAGSMTEPSAPGEPAESTPAATIGPYLRLEADLQALRIELAQRLELAIENVVRRRRGRPRGRGTSRP